LFCFSWLSPPWVNLELAQAAAVELHCRYMHVRWHSRQGEWRAQQWATAGTTAHQFGVLYSLLAA
jgi:hypothetical protein